MRDNLRIMSSIPARNIITSCPTCGLALKKAYPVALETDEEYRSLAQQVSSRTKDIVEFIFQDPALSNLIRGYRGRWREDHQLAYHDACHLAYGQRIRKEPRYVLGQLLGLPLKEIGGPVTCCGAGGAFHIWYPQLAKNILGSRIREIERLEVNSIVTGCPACILQIGGFLSRHHPGRYRILHVVQLIDELMTERRETI